MSLSSVPTLSAPPGAPVSDDGRGEGSGAAPTAPNGFALARFIDLSGAVTLDDLDWEAARRIGISAGEARMLRYMSDTESHTILYMRDLLAGYSTRDPEITAFLSVWVYEEFWHGRAIDRFLSAVGYPPPPDHVSKVTVGATLKEIAEGMIGQVLAYSTPKFIATHMTWGAINELTAAAAYLALARATANPVLAALCQRLAKQERKHFSFYYHQAERRLRHDVIAQKLCRVALKLFWDIVGSGVGERRSLEYLAGNLFTDETNCRVLIDADETIARLPGLSSFAMVRPAVATLIRNHERRSRMLL